MIPSIPLSKNLKLLRFCKKTFVYTILSTFASCTNSHLAVYTDYLSRENLASYRVGTPDPYLNYPPIGQRLIVTWTLKKSYLCFADLHLKITIRFRNKTESVVEYPIAKLKGTFLYSVLNGEYIETGGMLTYKVELIGEDRVLDEWRHQIWANYIRVGEAMKFTEQNDFEMGGKILLPESSENAEEDEFCKSVPE